MDASSGYMKLFWRESDIFFYNTDAVNKIVNECFYFINIFFNYVDGSMILIGNIIVMSYCPSKKNIYAGIS